MSRFFTKRYASLVPYVPGEQPRDMQYVKLNTNESPFPPSPGVTRAVQEASGKLQLYSDPESTALKETLAALYGLQPSQVLPTNGSDEALNFAFMAFADQETPLAFPDLTYGFYTVFADLNHIPYQQIPLKEDFTIDPADYLGLGKTIVIANPNAPTGIPLSLVQVEGIVAGNRDSVVIIDEAYVDFGGESAVGLIDRYDNLLVVQTFSKSRSMAGARLGFAMGNEALIRDLNTIKYSTNPYNVNRMTEAAGIAALKENDYYMANCRAIMENRQWTKEALESLGFTVFPSRANFLFAKHPALDGEDLYRTLKQRGILVRHFTKERIRDYNRITVGTRQQMELLVAAITHIVKENAL